MNSSGPNTSGFRIRIPPEVEGIPYARLVLRWALPELDETSSALFYGAVTEVATNAVTAHMHASTTRPVEIRVQGELGAQAIEVRDYGTGFDQNEIKEGSSDESGFGLTIARSVCPDLSITSAATGTTVRLPFPELTAP